MTHIVSKTNRKVPAGADNVDFTLRILRELGNIKISGMLSSMKFRSWMTEFGQKGENSCGDQHGKLQKHSLLDCKKWNVIRKSKA